MLQTVKRSKGMLVTNDVKYKAKEKRGISAIKQEAKDNLTVTVDGITFDADAQSISYMSSAITIANKHILDAMAADSSLSVTDAFNKVYSTTVKWKAADNNIYDVKIKTLAEALEKALGAVGNIVGV